MASYTRASDEVLEKGSHKLLELFRSEEATGVGGSHDDLALPRVKVRISRENTSMSASELQKPRSNFDSGALKLRA